MTDTTPPQSNEQIHDSPRGWVARHIHAYVESAGRRGHRWQGVNTLLLTTRGRRTGRLRRTALIYGHHGDSYIVVASNGGSDQHPDWYGNLLANPQVRIQVGADQVRASAEPAVGEDRPTLWGLMTDIWPEYDNYQKRTTRQIPIVQITPSTRSAH